MRYSLPESELEDLRREAKIEAYRENLEKLDADGYEDCLKELDDFSILKEIKFQELLSERHERLYE